MSTYNIKKFRQNEERNQKLGKKRARRDALVIQRIFFNPISSVCSSFIARHKTKPPRNIILSCLSLFSRYRGHNEKLNKKCSSKAEMVKEGPSKKSERQTTVG